MDVSLASNLPSGQPAWRSSKRIRKWGLGIANKISHSVERIERVSHSFEGRGYWWLLTESIIPQSPSPRKRWRKPSAREGSPVFQECLVTTPEITHCAGRSQCLRSSLLKWIRRCLLLRYRWDQEQFYSECSDRSKNGWSRKT